MEINIASNIIKTNSETIKCVEDYFIFICSEIKLNSKYIKKIVFADNEFYEKEIKKINNSENFTNTESHKGFAKTICLLENNELNNFIIFRSELLIILIKIANKELDIKDIVNLFYIFIFYHELSHCLDNINRFKGNKILFPKNDFKIVKLLNYYYDILLSEIAANSLSSFFYNSNLLLNDINTIETEFDLFLKNNEKLKKDYHKNNDLYILSVGLLGNIFVFFIQLSKVLSIIINNKELSNYLINLKEKINDKILDFDSLVNILEKLFKIYPKWNNEISKKFIEIILSTMLKYGFKFVINEKGNDALYF